MGSKSLRVSLGTTDAACASSNVACTPPDTAHTKLGCRGASAGG